MTITTAVPRVEVAFGFGPYDPEPLAMDWTDITESVLEVRTVRGRPSEFDRFQAGTATVVLLNDERQWDPLNAAGPHYGELVANVPIRIIGDVDGTDYPIWRGYVDGWPAVYTEGGFRSEVAVNATDALKILAERRMPDTFRAFLDEFGAPSTWYRCDRLNDGVLVDSGPNGLDMNLTTAATTTDALVPVSSGAVQFPEIQPPDVLTYVWAAQRPILNASQHLTGGLQWTVAFVAQAVKREARGVFWARNADESYWVVSMGFAATGRFIAAVFDPATGWVLSLTSPSSLFDGRPHRIALVRWSGNLYLYVDGQLAAADYDVSATTTVNAAGGYYAIGAIGGDVGDFTGFLLDELMVWPSTGLSGTEVAELDEALTVGFSGVRPSGTAIGDVLDEIGWLSGLRNIDNGEVLVNPPANPGGVSVLELLHRLAGSEDGRLFVDAEGRVTFHGRNRFLVETVESTVQYTFTDTDRDLTTPPDVGLLDGTLSIKVDDRQTFDAAEITREGGIPQTATLTANPVRTFVAQNLLMSTDGAALSLAQWYPFRYGTPEARSEAWEVDPEIRHEDWPALLGLEIGHRVKLDLTPGGLGSSIELEQHVSYIEHLITAERWLIKLNGTPIDPNDYFLWDTTETTDNDHGWADSDGDPAGGAWG